MATAIATLIMEEDKTATVSAQEKWSQSDPFARGKMLDLIGYSRSYAGMSWKKLPYLVRTNLQARTWSSEN